MLATTVVILGPLTTMVIGHGAGGVVNYESPLTLQYNTPTSPLLCHTFFVGQSKA